MDESDLKPDDIVMVTSAHSGLVKGNILRFTHKDSAGKCKSTWISKFDPKRIVATPYFRPKFVKKLG